VGRFLYLDDGRGNTRFENEIALKTHLGNTKVTLDHHGDTIKKIDYYPFGHMIYTSDTETPFAEDNHYLYNDKGLQDDFGLDWYDYGVRFYDGQIGKFHTQDRFAEKYYDFSTLDCCWLSSNFSTNSLSPGISNFISKA